MATWQLNHPIYQDVAVSRAPWSGLTNMQAHAAAFPTAKDREQRGLSTPTSKVREREAEPLQVVQGTYVTV